MSNDRKMTKDERELAGRAVENALKAVLEVNLKGLAKFDGIDYKSLLAAIVADAQRIYKEGEAK